MEIILKYFPDLTEEQRKQFAALYDLYIDWNSKINVISRKDIENLYEHHVLHSLGIAKTIQFRPGTSIMDLGTGGGFPGIPLAILFPEVTFHLVDSIGKKVRVATEVANAIGLKNVTFRHARAEEEKRTFDFVVSRAVMPLADLIKIIKKNISSKQVLFFLYDSFAFLLPSVCIQQRFRFLHFHTCNHFSLTCASNIHRRTHF